MSAPVDRETFKDYCLRALGAPVVEINVDPDQVDDRVDDSLLLFRDYHFDGTNHQYFKHQVTAQDMANRYLTLDPSIIGVVRIFDVGESTNLHSLFNLRYQIRMNDLFDFSGRSIVPYVMMMRQIETLQETFVGHKPVRFNRNTHILYVDFDWNADIVAGEHIIIDGYEIVDPNVYTMVWNDPWLKRYATALIKRQWGANMSKFKGIPLLGGVTMDGQSIKSEAEAEIKDLERELVQSWSLPSDILTG